MKALTKILYRVMPKPNRRRLAPFYSNCPTVQCGQLLRLLLCLVQAESSRSSPRSEMIADGQGGRLNIRQAIMGD